MLLFTVSMGGGGLFFLFAVWARASVFLLFGRAAEGTFLVLFGRGACCFWFAGPGRGRVLLLFGRGTGLHSITGLPGLCLGGPTIKKNNSKTNIYELSVTGFETV